MKVSILTLGCKANQSESYLIEARLRSKGCKVVDLDEKPEYCIINTCSVTSKSDYQSRQLIRRASRSGSRVIVTGCYSELNKNMVSGMDGVITVVDIDQKEHIHELLGSHQSTVTSYVDLTSKSRFFLKVQDGCNYSCSYCIIPKARGRSRSLDIETVLNQIIAVSDTFNEIVLTGIHLGTYGYDLFPKVLLTDLLTAILLRTKIKRVRLSSLEIGEIDDKLLDLVQEERVCKHLHIPLQSGDDRILALMNRKYSSSELLTGITAVLRRMPDIAIGTDIIAGFPGEDEEEFNNTLNFLECLPISYIHVFPYSARPGTSAAQMPGSVDFVTAKRRCAALRALGQRKKKGFLAAQLGKTLDLLVEEIGPGPSVFGTTGNYLKVRAAANNAKAKDVVPVSIAGVDDDMLIGLPIRSL